MFPCVALETHALMVETAAPGFPWKSTCCRGASYPLYSTDSKVGSRDSPCCTQSVLAMSSSLP